MKKKKNSLQESHWKGNPAAIRLTSHPIVHIHPHPSLTDTLPSPRHLSHPAPPCACLHYYKLQNCNPPTSNPPTPSRPSSIIQGFLLHSIFVLIPLYAYLYSRTRSIETATRLFLVPSLRLPGYFHHVSFTGCVQYPRIVTKLLKKKKTSPRINCLSWLPTYVLCTPSFLYGYACIRTCMHGTGRHLWLDSLVCFSCAVHVVLFVSITRRHVVCEKTACHQNSTRSAKRNLDVTLARGVVSCYRPCNSLHTTIYNITYTL